MQIEYMFLAAVAENMAHIVQHHVYASIQTVGNNFENLKITNEKLKITSAAICKQTAHCESSSCPNRDPAKHQRLT